MPGYDWENDDRPDHTPDSWLDRLTSSSAARGAVVRNGTGKGSSSQQQQKSRAPAGGRRTNSPSTRPTDRDIADAAHAIRSEIPNIGYKGIAKRLRQRGWTHVDYLIVGTALQRHPTPTVREAKRAAAPPKPRAEGQRTVRAKKGTAQASGAGDASGLRGFEKAVRAARTHMPGMDVPGIVRHLRRYGWPYCTEAEVRRALRAQAPVERPRAGDKPLTTRSRSEKPKLRPSLRVPPPPPVDICPSCAVRISVLGTCRCS